MFKEDFKYRLGLSGFILIDKPSGITSHDVVDEVRKKFKIRKVGHCGTLDPLATGLIIILIGSYTSKQQEFQNLDKVYEGKIKLGVTTDSWDREGEVIREIKEIKLTEEMIEKAIPLFEGTVSQLIPPYSAVKYKGEKLYNLARRKKTIPLLRKTVRIKWLDWSYADGYINFKIRCSSGTYIRSIAYELGEVLGCGAILDSLRRIAIGDWDINLAIKLEDFKNLGIEDLVKVVKR